MLQYPNWNGEFILVTGTRETAIGAVLLQKLTVKDKRDVILAWTTLNSVETRFSTKEKELLAVVYALPSLSV